MLNHKSAITTILLKESSTKKQHQALQIHLAECADCKKFSMQWQAAQGLLAEPVIVAPRPGFSGRWKSMAESRKREQSRQPGWWWVSAIVGASVFGFGFLVWSGITKTDLLSAGREAAANAVSNIGEAIHLLNLFAWTVGQSLPVAVWIVGAVFVFGISLLWLILLRRIASQNDEE
jgi:hypothetical protein